MSKTPVGAIFDDPAGLGSMLSRRPQGRRTAPEARPRVVTDPEAAETQKPSTERRGNDVVGEKRPSSTTRPKQSATKRPPDTIVYVTPTQAEAVRRERRETGRTITEIVLSAVERAAPRLDGAFQPDTPQQTQGRLFQGSVTAKSEDDGLGKVQLCLRMIQSDRAALDQLASQVKAPSRSHLVRKALALTGPAGE